MAVYQTVANMLVSICIPTCDRPLLLWEAILSCFAQSHRPLEVLIGDDSANDDSKSLVETIVSPQGVTLRYRRNRPRLGQAGNVNSLFDAACGDWIILLHDDDTLLPGAVGLLLDRFNSDPEIVAAYGKQWLMSFDGAVLEQESESLNRFYFRDPGHAGTRLSALEAALVQQFPNDGYMVRSSAARALRYPEEGETDRVSWCDFAFGLRLAQHGPFHFLSAFTAKYRITPGSIGTQGSSWTGALDLVGRIMTTPDTAWSKDLALSRIAPKAIREQALRGEWREALSIYISAPGGWNQRLCRSGLKNLALILHAMLKGMFGAPQPTGDQREFAAPSPPCKLESRNN